MFTPKTLMMPMASIILLLLLGCNGSDSSSDDDDDQPSGSSLPEAQGYAQKGPMQSGADVTLTALEEGQPTGDPITTQTGTYGEFDFDEIDINGPALLSVEGYFFDEAAGNFTGTPVELKSVVFIDDDEDFSTNVNMLTHLLHEHALEQLAEREPDGDEPKDILADVLDDYLEMTDLSVSPINLNLLADHEDPIFQQESALLLALSIAASAADDVQDLLDDLAAGWDGDSGEFTDSNQDRWDDLLVDAGDKLNDIDDYIQALEDFYSGTQAAQPVDDWSRIGQATTCSTGRMVDPDAPSDAIEICLYRPTERLFDEDETKYFVFEQPDDGAFYISVSGTNVDSNLYTSSSPDHSGQSIQDCLDGCALGAQIRSAGSYLIVTVRNLGGSGNEATITARRYNQGSPGSPTLIDPARAERATLVNNDYEQFAGTARSYEMSDTGGSNDPNHSYYWFVLPPGHSSLFVELSPCGGIMDHELRVRLHSRSPSAVDWTASSESDGLIGNERTDDCEMEFELNQSGGTYTLQASNFQPAAYYQASGIGTRRFHIRAE